MNPNDPNVSLIEIVAERLGDDLRENVVFVGGAVAGLLITDPAMPAIRPTEDVDLVCQAVGCLTTIGLRTHYAPRALRRTCARRRRFVAGRLDLWWSM